jgi:hypothetical protein
MSVQVVNMIPPALSDEQEQDSEPSITVNPANALEIVGTAFTPDPLGGPLAPIYVSTDGGLTWVLNFNVPSEVQTGDITVAFGGAKNRLYAGILRLPRPAPGKIRLNVLRTDDFRSSTPMTVLDDRLGVDQPFISAMTVGGKDRLFVGGNDFASPEGRTATIDRYLNAGIRKPTKQSIRIEARSTGTARQNGPAIRPACTPDGRVYGVFYGWRSFNRNTRLVTADVVVVRDDHTGGRNANSFAVLKDSNDGLVGQIVKAGATFTWNALLGQQRIGGDISVAANPKDSRVVYVAWAADGPNGYTVTVQRSKDAGQTWSQPIRVIVNAINPSLAVNSERALGLLYQQLQGADAAARWVTQFETTPDEGATWNRTVLANVPAMQPLRVFHPYIGDYANVTAVGPDFYGIFSANNTPDKANFPNDVVYKRNADFERKVLLGIDGVTEVPVSIDPFFFKVPKD